MHIAILTPVMEYVKELYLAIRRIKAEPHVTYA